jgi:putative transposase
MLRERLGRFPVSALGYCVTSNHVHLLLRIKGEEDALSRFMQSLQGDFARAYNIRRRRNGAFWTDRYHAVMIDGGAYLWRCLLYIDLNMVRAGAVTRPDDWAWCGYQELMGLRKRYRLLDVEALAEALAPGHCSGGVAKAYREMVDEALRVGQMARDARWTESLAVGGESFVREIAPRIPNRMTVETTRDGELWLVREPDAPYGRFPGPKSASKVPNPSALVR